MVRIKSDRGWGYSLKKSHRFFLILAIVAFVNMFIAWGEVSSAEYIRGEILVKFKNGTTNENRENAHGFINSYVWQDFEQIGVQHILLPEGMSVENGVAYYQSDPNVEYAEPNYIGRGLGTTPNDLYFSPNQWSLLNTGQIFKFNPNTSGTNDADIDVDGAWDTTTGSPSVVIAVIDSGIRATHEDLKGNLWINPGEIAGNGIDDDGNNLIDDITGWDFFDNDNNTSGGHTHGTNSASIIGASGNNGKGIAGVMWQVSLMALKVTPGTTNEFPASDVVGAILYAVIKGARIINASYSFSTFPQTAQLAYQFAQAGGVLVVAAAGNDGVNNDFYPPITQTQHYPCEALLSNILCVAATDHNDALTSFSNFGATSVDVAAPGQLIAAATNESDSAYDFANGTSFSAPIVSGIAGLLLSQDSSLTYQQLKDLIIKSVDAKSGLSGKIVTGGRVNAARALANMSSLPAAPSQLQVVSLTSTTATITWADNSSNETGFIVERKDGQGFFFDIGSRGANITYGVAIGLQLGRFYTFRVRAVNTSGSSGFSNEAKVFLGSGLSPPTISSISTSRGLTTGGQVVTITGSNFTSDTAVTFGGVSARIVIILSSTTLTATTPTHAAGTVNVAVTTAASTATLSGGFTYAGATVFLVTKGTQGSQVTSKWTSAADAVSYSVFRASCPTCPKVQIASNFGTTVIAGGGGTIVYLDTTAEPGLTYIYSIRIKNASGQVIDLGNSETGCTQSPANLSLTSKSFATPITYGATNSIVAGGNVNVASGGNVTFHMRNTNGSILLQSGFSVLGGSASTFKALVSNASSGCS